MAKLNYLWRLMATAFSFTVFGLGGATIPWLAAPIICLSTQDPLKRQRKARKLIQLTFYGFVAMMRFLGILTWDVRHIARLQRPGLLVLANHPCLIDVVFLVAFTPHADCIVKGRLLSNPAMRGFIRLTGFISNDSGDELVDNARESIGKGSALIIFPEGTRTVPGQPLRFARGAANMALRTHTAVTPVVITCNPITLSKQHQWYHIPARKFHITLTVNEDIPVTPYQHLAPSLAARQLTEHLQQYFTQELKHHD